MCPVQACTPHCVMCGGQSWALCVFVTVDLPVWRQGPSLNGKLITSLMLARVNSGTIPVFTPQCWGDRHLQPCLSFMWVVGMPSLPLMAAGPSPLTH